MNKLEKFNLKLCEVILSLTPILFLLIFIVVITLLICLGVLCVKEF